MKFITQAAKVLNEQKKYKRRLAVFLCLAVVVALGTAAALKMYGQAMSHKQKKLVCRYAAHAHTDGCFDGEAVVCGYADYAVHLHNDDCYGPNGELVCHLPEAEAHVHTEECYTEQEVLICEEEGAQAHEHTEGCYTPERGDLSCQMEEHMHEDSCYGENGEIICPLEEHQHDDNCYEWKDVLTCTLGGHEHTQDCYTREMRDLSCNLEEHGHGEACYDENGELACQLEEHTHDDNCYVWEDVLTCQLEESDGGHVHGDGCYEMQKVLSCGKLELHTHDDSCCDENGALVCGLLQLEEHVHGEDCFETVELTEEEIIALSGDGEESVSEDAVSEDSVSGDSVSADDAKEAHEHTDECYDAAGGLICGFETVEEPSITKTFEDEDGRYIVTASYYEKAEIPEEAELKAEMITAESNGEHFAQRESEVRETLEDESVSMNALFKIGFYVEEEEIEPKDDVSVTVQFLDEDGFADGSPIAVVHFAEDGSKVLNGGKAKDKSTTFKTNSFSEFGIVDGYEVEEAEPAAEDGIIPVSESFEYEDDAYHITFHIEGDARLLTNEDSIENNEDDVAVSSNDITVDDENIVNSDNIASEDAVDTMGDSYFLDKNDEDDKESIISSPSENDTQNAEKTTKQELELKTTSLSEDSEEYAAIEAYAVEISQTTEPLFLRTLKYCLVYEGAELDLGECDITAEIVPAGELIERAEKITDDTKTRSNIEVTALEVSMDAQIDELDTMLVEKKASQYKPMVLTVDGDNPLAFYSTIEENPKFKVQYYANLNVAKTKSIGDKTTVELIDTSKDSNNGVAKLPTNTNKSPKIKYLQLKDTGGGALGNLSNIHTVEYESTLMEIYEEETFDFWNHTELDTVNKFRFKEDTGSTEDKIKNNHYDLKKVQHLETNTKGEVKIIKEYANLDDLRLTNNETVAANNPDNVILIKNNTIIRLIADSNTGLHDNNATFYDYDITDGKVYSDKKFQTEGRRDSSDTLYVNTNRKGINSKSNYQVNSSAPLYGFGNNNTGGTGLQSDKIGNYFINRATIDADVDDEGYPALAAYGNCSFGIVKNSLTDEGYPDFNVPAPDLFSLNDKDTQGPEKVTGKTIIPGYSLNFNRDGDTYTLTSVNDGTGTTKDLDKFRGRNNWNKTRYLWTNQFWPMDSASTYGQDGHDLIFGDKNKEALRRAIGSKDEVSLPTGDDEKDHNSFFGMSFSVDFELTRDYKGPLNYYFFGDDDMWVFLDNELVCDIGGVHSSVGEYVNLWDYIQQGDSKKHTLKFFYTERGASGSTCWMQFTLPSVSSGIVDKPTGNIKNTLTVGKTVSGANTDQEFEFVINFKKGNELLTHCYSYVIKDANSTDEDNVESGSITSGGSFKLKDGQFIIINNLPDGATYTIKEKDYSGYLSEINGTVEADRTAEGNIDWSKDDVVSYINQEIAYELPETGGTGLLLYTIAGVFSIIIGAGFMYKKRILERRE